MPISHKQQKESGWGLTLWSSEKQGQWRPQKEVILYEMGCRAGKLLANDDVDARSLCGLKADWTGIWKRDPGIIC